MLYYGQNSTYFDLNSTGLSPTVIIDTVKVKNSANVSVFIKGGHEITIQNIELENNIYQFTSFSEAMFFIDRSDIATIRNVAVNNHSNSIFWAQYVLTQKFYNCTFTNIRMNDASNNTYKNIILSSRFSPDLSRNNTEEPVTIFQDLHVDVMLEYILTNRHNRAIVILMDQILTMTQQIFR